MRVANFMLVCSLLFIVACGQKQSGENAFIVGTSPDNPPYEYIKNGDVVGFDPELVELIAKELGRNVVIKNMEFSSLIPALTSGHIHIAIAGLSVTDARKENISFSNPYLTTRTALITKRDSGIYSSSDLKNKHLGVQLGTTWETLAQKMASEVENLSIQSVTNNLILIEELKNNKVDAVLMEDIQMENFLKNNSDLAGFVIPGHESEFAIAVSSQDPELVNQINQAIESLKSKGKIEELKNKWMKP